MTRRRLTALGAALLLTTTGIVAERHYAATQRSALASAQAQLARLDTLLKEEQRTLAALRQIEANAQREAATARAEAIRSESASTMKLWATRIAILKRLLAEMPVQGIPELRLLGPLDWVEVVRKHELDSAERIRTAFAVLRANSRGKFAKYLQEALRTFITASGGLLPDNISHLAAYLSPPADREMLERYTLTRTGRLGDEKEHLIREIASSDMLLSVSLNSWDMALNKDRPADAGDEAALITRTLAAITQAMKESGVDDAMAGAFFETFLGNGPNEGGAQGLIFDFERRFEALEKDGFTAALKVAVQQHKAEHDGALPATLADLRAYTPMALRFVTELRPVFAELDYLIDHDGARPTSPEQLERYLKKPIEPDKLLRRVALKITDDDVTLNFSASAEREVEPSK